LNYETIFKTFKKKLLFHNIPKKSVLVGVKEGEKGVNHQLGKEQNFEMDEIRFYTK